jgi:1-aminocyclopropane-1-carboxylate synthase
MPTLLLPQKVASEPHVAIFLDSDIFIVLTYGDGSTGSCELRSVVADYLNHNFAPVEPVAQEHVTIGGGITAIIDALSFCIAEPGEGILVAQPVYVGYVNDFEDRAG